MRRLLVVLPFVIATAGCSRKTFRWQPSLVSQVPDSTPVRFAVARGQPVVSGRSLGWQVLTPRIITARGDTVAIPTGSQMQVRLKNKKNHALTGAVIGYLVGFGVAYAACPEPKSDCSGQALTPHLVAGTGAVIGAIFKTDDWVRVRWDSR